MIISTVLIVAAMAYFIYSAQRHDEALEKKQARDLERAEEERLSSEHVAKEQTEFEANLVRELEIGTPTAIMGQRAFLYWQLMRKWFSTLDAQNRYDDAKAKKIRQDWLSYMGLLDEEATCQFLAFEGREEKREQYSERLPAVSLARMAIEEAFATAIGPEAVSELARVKSAKHDAFDPTGRKPMASYNWFDEMDAIRRSRDARREPEAQQRANKIKSEETEELSAEMNRRMADAEAETERRKNERLKDKERLLPLRWNAETASPERREKQTAEKTLEEDRASYEARDGPPTAEPIVPTKAETTSSIVLGLIFPTALVVLLLLLLWFSYSQSGPKPTLGNAQRDEASTDASLYQATGPSPCDPIFVGKNCVLHADDSSPADELNHNGWAVTVLKPQQSSRYYFVKASDGWEGAVNGSELSAVP
jgi:hypothetical protein